MKEKVLKRDGSSNDYFVFLRTTTIPAVKKGEPELVPLVIEQQTGFGHEVNPNLFGGPAGLTVEQQEALNKTGECVLATIEQ